MLAYKLTLFVCLISSLRPSQQSFSYVGTGLQGLGSTSTKQELMCLDQGHNSVRLESTAPQSRVKHSTTEPLFFH